MIKGQHPSLRQSPKGLRPFLRTKIAGKSPSCRPHSSNLLPGEFEIPRLSMLPNGCPLAEPCSPSYFAAEWPRRAHSALKTGRPENCIQYRGRCTNTSRYPTGVQHPSAVKSTALHLLIPRCRSTVVLPHSIACHSLVNTTVTISKCRLTAQHHSSSRWHLGCSSIDTAQQPVKSQETESHRAFITIGMSSFE